MSLNHRLDLLKSSVIHTIDELPNQTRVSVYYYNDTTTTLFVNKSVSEITLDDRNSILNMTASRGTNSSVAIRTLVQDLRSRGGLNESIFDHVTIAWLTDGDERQVRTSDHLVALFQQNYCLIMPRLIPVIIGHETRPLMTSISLDERFQSQTLIRINLPDEINKLFNLLARNLEIIRSKAILVTESAGKIMFYDLGFLKSSETKHLLIEIPKPPLGSGQMRWRLLYGERTFEFEDDLPLGFDCQNNLMLVNYFKQLQSTIQTNPLVIHENRVRAFKLIPPTILDLKLQSFRNAFKPFKTAQPLLEDDLIDAVSQPSWSFANALSSSSDIRKQIQQQHLQKNNLLSSQIIFDDEENIDILSTLSYLMNDFISTKLEHSLLEIREVGFYKPTLAFRIQLICKHPDLSITDFLESFYTLFKINRMHVEWERQLRPMSATIKITDPLVIINLFQVLGYESLLNNHSHCLASQVDLLQILMTKTMDSMVNTQSATYLFENIEFDFLGNLTAIVLDPNGNRYQIKSTDELLGSFKKYCGLELSPHFVELIRRQVIVNAVRYAKYLGSSYIDNTPLIFAENQLVDVKICENKKQFSADLKRRAAHIEPLNSYERRFFQKRLAIDLGDTFLVDWCLYNSRHHLLISCPPSRGEWTSDDVTRLAAVLDEHHLLTQVEIDRLSLDKLVGTPQPAYCSIPEEIETILSCKILFTLPDGMPRITPTGNSYDLMAITQHLEFHKTDPISRNRLNHSQLRENHLAYHLIQYYTRLTSLPRAYVFDPDVYPPDLLINPLTGAFYDDPIVNALGETVNGPIDLVYPKAYSNRCIAELTDYYHTVLNSRDTPLRRQGLRATVGANISVLCPGAGALSEQTAQNETTLSVPYVEYDVLTETLIIYFLSQDYARRFELGLKRWYGHDDGFKFVADQITRLNTQSRKRVRSIDGDYEALIFHSVVMIKGADAINVLFKHLCAFSQGELTNLKKISGSDDMEYPVTIAG